MCDGAGDGRGTGQASVPPSLELAPLSAWRFHPPLEPLWSPPVCMLTHVLLFLSLHPSRCLCHLPIHRTHQQCRTRASMCVLIKLPHVWMLIYPSPWSAVTHKVGSFLKMQDLVPPQNMTQGPGGHKLWTWVHPECKVKKVKEADKSHTEQF